MTAPEDGRRVFPTEEAALKAVAQQVRAQGIWTSPQRQGDGWVLRFDTQADRGTDS